MLYPQTNACRTVIDLSGIWEVKKAKGLTDHEFAKGFKPEAFIGVPGSWNEQLSEIGLMDYVGPLLYQRRFRIPHDLKGRKLIIRFDSADFSAIVWINGKKAGIHEGGYLPFQLEITDLVSLEHENIVVVKVDNSLNHDTIPQGLTEEDYNEFNILREQSYPSTVFDFYAYGGLNRPVSLLSLPGNYLESIVTETSISKDQGIIRFRAEYNVHIDKSKVRVSLWDDQDELLHTIFTLDGITLVEEIFIPNCKFWGVLDPNLYKIRFELLQEESIIDEYEIEIGVREIKIEQNQLLLNGEPVFLKGFGKHEDFFVLGKGLSTPLIVKDFELMKWIGANSFRTSHYPYAEEIIHLADKMGFLVIDEVPAVSLNFRYVTKKTKENHKAALKALIERDKNHPSVIAWSIANEPGIWGEKEAVSEEAEDYWKDIYDYTKSLDDTRPITLPTCAKWGLDDPVYKYCDLIAINRYWGWYEIPGDISRAGEVLETELKQLYEKYKKPIIVTEFGADTIEGEHATYSQMFTEEYQTELILKYFEIIESLPFMVGEHIWNFADFQTAQHFRRVVLNKKGVFNRQRQPKQAAFAIRDHWRGK